MSEQIETYHPEWGVSIVELPSAGNDFPVYEYNPRLRQILITPPSSGCSAILEEIVTKADTA